MTPHNEQLREEFYSKIAEFSDDNHHDVEPYSMQKIADWWLSRFTAERAELVRRVEELNDECEGENDDFNNGLKAMKSDILALLRHTGEDNQ